MKVIEFRQLKLKSKGNVFLLRGEAKQSPQSIFIIMKPAPVQNSIRPSAVALCAVSNGLFSICLQLLSFSSLPSCMRKLIHLALKYYSYKSTDITMTILSHSQKNFTLLYTHP